LYSCLDAFVVGASDYSGHLIRHLLNVSEVFPMKWFLQFCEQVKVWWAEPTRLYFPSEGRGAGDIFALKNPTTSAGFEPTDIRLEIWLKIMRRILCFIIQDRTCEHSK
jgi:hypothetical protein